MAKAAFTSVRELDIQEFRHVMLKSLKYIDMICRKEGIKYFAAYGTLLGAVRHKGFIPWDDDTDVLMMRSEYDKFCEAVKKYPDPRFFLQTTKTDRGFSLPSLGRICSNDTIRWPGDNYVDVRYHAGIYVDISPIDFAFPTQKQTLKRFKAQMLLKKLMYKRLRRLRHIRNIETFLFTAMLKLPPIEFYNWIFSRIINNPNPDKSMLIDFTGGYSFEKHYWPAHVFNETVELPFEDMTIPCPAGYDELLRIIYGDYMIPIDRHYVRPLVKKDSPLF